MSARRRTFLRRRALPWLAAVAALVAALLLGVASDALAQSGNEVGRNIGDLLEGTGAQIYGGIVAVVGLIFLINRRYTELGIFVLAAVVVAWLVFSPDQVASAARAIGRQVLG
ncbi:MAG TPA: hypothetical protein VLK58_04750 [Conexibacter sp.]|nr:hypothetical protein [Conexibacter sp.]